MTLRQEFKWRELEEQRKAERLHKRLQQEQAYLLSLQHEPKPVDKARVPSDHSKSPQNSTLPPDRLLSATPQAQVLDEATAAARGAYDSPSAPQTVPSDGGKSQVPPPLERPSEAELPNTPALPQTEPPADSEPPQADGSEPDLPSEPPQPIREVIPAPRPSQPRLLFPPSS